MTSVGFRRLRARTTRSATLTMMRSASFHPAPDRRGGASSSVISSILGGAGPCKRVSMGGMRIEMDDGTGLAVEVAGSGPGLILVHGFGGVKEDFADHVDELARDHTVVTFDHRGHGAS